MVTFELYVRPYLLKKQGKNSYPQQVIASIKEKVTKKKGIRYFVRVKLNKTEQCYEASFTCLQKIMVFADGLLILPEEVEIANSGDRF